MTYGTKTSGISIKKLKYTGRNGAGDCFVAKNGTLLPTLVMSAKFGSDGAEKDFQTLIIISSELGIPLKYDFDKHTASIEVMSVTALRKANEVI